MRWAGCAELPEFHPSAASYVLPMRGDSRLIICWYGLRLDGIRSIAFLAKGLACSCVYRLSIKSNIHSRMIFRRASCSGFMLKVPCSLAFHQTPFHLRSKAAIHYKHRRVHDRDFFIAFSCQPFLARLASPPFNADDEAPKKILLGL
jgi:hypothetical protein